MAVTLSAQTTAVKEIANSFKTNTGASAKALQDMQSYLTSDETKNDPATWIVAAKAGIGVYDHTMTQASLTGNVDNNGKRAAGNGLNSAYNYLFTALPLDSVPDAKGKIKAKHSKEIIKLLRENYQSLKQAGIWLYEAQDYDGAVQAWEYYVTLPKQACMAGSGLQADPDTIVGQLMNYQVLALLLNKKPEQALAVASRVPATGFESIDVYRYALAAAQEMNDTTAMMNYASKGYQKYAAEDPDLNFLGTMINIQLSKGDYKGAGELVEQAIAMPNNSTDQLANLYNLKGSIAEQMQDMAAAEKYFNMAVDVKPDFAKGIYDKARIIFNNAQNRYDEADESVREGELKPMLLRAAELFEQAYDLDEVNLSQIPGILYRLFYQVEGDSGVNTLKWEALK